MSSDTTVKGLEAVRQLINGGGSVDRIAVNRTAATFPLIRALIRDARDLHVKVQILSESAFLKEFKNEASVVAFKQLKSAVLVNDIIKNMKSHQRIVVADHIEDPQNFGAILRSCEVFGYHTILFPKDRAAQLNGTVINASAGSANRLSLCKTANLAESVRKLKKAGYWIISSHPDQGTDIGEFQPLNPCVLVVGNEHRGVSQVLLKLSDSLVKIPQHGGTASLNVSVATGVILAAISRSSNKTEKKKQSIAAAVEKIHQEFEELRDGFLRTVSHELRTPLTSVMGFIELVASGMLGEMNRDQKKYLKIAYNGAANLKNTINDLIEMSVLEAGKVRLNISQVDVMALVKGVCEEFQLLAQGKKIKLSWKITPSILQIRADFEKLRRVLVNLVGNALKFTNEGEVSVIASADIQEVHFEVRDTGIGLAKEDLDVIFEKFRQKDYSITRSYEGIGIGLSIVKHLVGLHKGHIEVSSAPQNGTIFTITIPSQGNCI